MMSGGTGDDMITGEQDDQDVHMGNAGSDVLDGLTNDSTTTAMPLTDNDSCQQDDVDTPSMC